MKFNKISINSDWLKIIALILMTLDHFAKIFSSIPCNDVLQFFGRMSFPIFSFILMYHLYKNQIYKKYLIRLGVFSAVTFVILKLLQMMGADISNVPFNILYMFFVCVLALAIKKVIECKINNNVWRNIAICVNYVLCGALVYKLSLFAFVYIILIYYFFEKPVKVNVIVLLAFAFLVNLGGFYGFVAMIVTALLMCVDYDKVYKRLIKKWYVFYLYYPLHLAILLLAAMYINML